MYVYTRKIILGTKEKNKCARSLYSLFHIYTHTYVYTHFEKESKQNVNYHLLTRYFSKNYETKFTRCKAKLFTPSLFLS